MAITLVTGGHGFIGQRLVRLLSRKARRIVGLGHGAWPQAQEDGLLAWINGELDRDNFDAISTQFGYPETIFHLAGGSHVGTSFASPLEDFRRSVETTARLLEWVKDKSRDTVVVFASSAAVYGSRHEAAISESAERSPESPYGVHKAMAEDLCASYARHFGLRVAVIRLFSVYGPGLRKQIVWEMCRRIHRRETPLVLAGTGDEKRDWIHVDDAVRALELGEKLADSNYRVVNGGTGTSTSVAQLAGLVTNAWKVAPAVFSGASRSGDPSSLVANIAFARSLGFSPTKDLQTGIRETVSWYQKEVSSSS